MQAQAWHRHRRRGRAGWGQRMVGAEDEKEGGGGSQEGGETIIIMAVSLGLLGLAWKPGS